MQFTTILYVEDEPDIRRIVNLLFKQHGFEVHDFDSGKAALAEAGNISADLIVLDVMLKDMTGEIILSHLRKLETFAHTPCIFLTAKVDSESVEILRNLYRADIIFKPFSIDNLITDLERLYVKLTNQ